MGSSDFLPDITSRKNRKKEGKSRRMHFDGERDLDQTGEY